MLLNSRVSRDKVANAGVFKNHQQTNICKSSAINCAICPRMQFNSCSVHRNSLLSSAELYLTEFPKPKVLFQILMLFRCSNLYPRNHKH